MPKQMLSEILGCMIFSTIFVFSAFADDYYVDADSGLDSATGHSPNSAWRTLRKLNQIEFSPGDHIYFASGSRWVGQLHPMGSGTAKEPIVIDRYGEGAMPVLDGAGATGRAVIHLHNQSHWVVNRLEITNDSPSGGDRRGVLISASNSGTIRGIRLNELYIHHIKGIIGDTIAAKDTGAIGVLLMDDSQRPTRFDDIKIENCRIETIDNTGIFSRSDALGANETTGLNWEKRRITGLVVRGNRISDIAKNAMIIRMADAGLIEHNVCWDTAYRAGTGNTMFSRSSKNTVFQYNEGYQNRSQDYDGSMYDADLDSPGCIFQYSYSHDNAHGLFWMCTTRFDSDVIVRYNISQNDKGIIFCLNYPVKSCYIYNNVVFISEHLSPTIIDERRDADKTYYFYNNIIYNMSPTASYAWRNGKGKFSNNLYFGHHPEGEPNGPGKLALDPEFEAAGTGGIGLDSLKGYMLGPGSPCIDAGTQVINSSKTDFWGNAAVHGREVDIGVHEFHRR